MAQKDIPITVYSADERTNYGTLSNGDLSNPNGYNSFVQLVKANIPPYSIIEKATWSLYAKRSSGTFVTGSYYWGVRASDNTVTTINSGGSLTTSYKQYTYPYTNYVCSGTADAGIIDESKCAQFYFGVSGSATKYHKNRAIGYTITLPTISVGIDGGGVIECEGSSYPISVTKDIDIGTEFTCTAVANAGYRFVCWSLDGIIVDTNVTKTFTTEQLVRTNTSYRAVFEPIPITVTVSAEPVDGGTVTGGGVYESGSTVTATAIPNEGYVFSHWLINGVNFGNSNPISGALTADTAVVAVFEKVQTSKIRFGSETVTAMYDTQKNKAKSVWYDKTQIL